MLVGEMPSDANDATAVLALRGGSKALLKPLTKSEFVYLEVRKRVRDGSLPPGTKLSLRGVADALGVSVMPVRDALVRLGDEGLVMLGSGREAVVADVSVDTVMQTLRLLTWNEVLAAIESAPRHTPADLRGIRAVLDAATEAIEAVDPIGYGKTSRRFHEMLGRHASDATRKTVDRISRRIDRAGSMFSNFQTLEFPEGHPGCMRSVKVEHENILASLESGRSDDITAALLSHRDSTLESFRFILRARQTS